MKNDLISVIIPVYNKALYIQGCLNSLINQTYKNLEIILVNDGSTDNSGEICDELQFKDNRIITIHQKNQGVSCARNNGFNISKGSFVIFIDADDELELNMLELLLNNLFLTNSDISICSYIRIEKNIQQKVHNKCIYSDKLTIYEREDALIKFFNGTFGIGMCNKLQKKAIMQNIRFEPNYSANEDKFFLFECLLKSQKVCFQDAPLYKYFERTGSLSSSCSTEKTICSINDIFYFSLKIKELSNGESTVIKQLAQKNHLIDLLCAHRKIYENKIYEKHKDMLIKFHQYITNFNLKEITDILPIRYKIEMFIIKRMNLFYNPLLKLYKKIVRNRG